MNKLLTWEELKKTSDRFKSEGKKIVFTNGCFDIIHIGHIRYLMEAKRLGDILIVGLNSDLSVKRLKKNRPINPQSHRAEVLSAIEYVDYVTIFDQDTPYELIKLLLPDILVKGGDWKKEDIVGSDLVPEVYSLNYIDGVSTTEIIKKIRMMEE
jgi:D-beta-D-heptose 7-phosphate kinase/D-beta-D-heptose 1-phosphate adenosyltransferase